VQERDPCGFPDLSDPRIPEAALDKWGYGYDSLLVDLARWRQSPYVRVDSAGASVQGRTLWVMTITSGTATPLQAGSDLLPKTRVWIHARTHPSEVQGWWVTREIIRSLLAESPFAQRLRQNCIFTIMPMYNPDGVELGYARTNAHGVDLESNWATTPNEPEVVVLRNTFITLMQSESPIRVALNMHSSYDCKRFFVYHAATGTSQTYAEDERRFIGSIRKYFPSGIQNWDYFISWKSGTPPQYPESWFWMNYREAVMALTYEDMNCPEAGNYDSTAYALLHGVYEYLGLPTFMADRSSTVPVGFSLEQNFPNPFNGSTTIRFTLTHSAPIQLRVVDLLGREVATLVDEPRSPGDHVLRFNGSGLASGVYVYRLRVGQYGVSRRMMVLR